MVRLPFSQISFAKWIFSWELFQIAKSTGRDDEAAENIENGVIVDNGNGQDFPEPEAEAEEDLKYEDAEDKEEDQEGDGAPAVMEEETEDPFPEPDDLWTFLPCPVTHEFI